MGRFTRTPYLILFVILISIGISSAYAITITLGGDPVIINGILDLMGNRIINVGTPTASTDAATKAYVDSASGTDTLALLGCTNNQVAQFVGSVWTCVDKVADADTLDGIDSTGFSQGAHTVDTDTLAGLGCTTDQVARFTGSVWECKTITFKANPIFTVDAGGNGGADDVGQYTSIAIGSDNFPIISYYDVTNGNLNIAKCGDVTCNPASVTITPVDTAGDVGRYTSIAIGSDTFPIVSYYDVSNGDLKTIHCSNAACTLGTIMTIDFTDDVGQYTSIAIGSDTFPIISYYDVTNGDLKAIHCSNAACTISTIRTIDFSDDVGQYTSINIGTDNIPLISYYDVTNGDLKVVHCGDVTCNPGSVTISLADAGGNSGADDVGQYTSITGLPPDSTDSLRIVYYGVTNGDLREKFCDDPICATGSAGPIDTINDRGQYASSVIGLLGRASASSYDATRGNLHINFVPADTTDDVGQYTSMAIGIDNFPITSYYDVTNGNLKVIIIGTVIIYS